MSTHVYAGKPVEVNDEGFLLDPSQWTPEVAQGIASDAGLTLTPEHWKVIAFCREDWAREHQSPGLRRITQKAGVTQKDLYRLFPKGPGKLAARIAGVEKPKACL